MAVSQSTLRVMTDLIPKHLDHMKAGPWADTTVRKRGELLRRVDRDLPFGIDGATVEELEGWLAANAHSPAAKHNYYHHIRGFFRWACDDKNPRLDWDPSASLAKPKVPAGIPNPVTDDEVEQALNRSGEPWWLAILLAAYAGLRCCELATVRREHITQQDIVVKGKGGKSRRIPTMPHVWAAVKDLPRGPVGPSPDPQWISRNGLYHFNRIGLVDVSMHRFRSWYATTMLANGVDLLTVSTYLGHASTETTRVYCLITDGQRRSAIAALPVLLAPASS